MFNCREAEVGVECFEAFLNTLVVSHHCEHGTCCLVFLQHSHAALILVVVMANAVWEEMAASSAVALECSSAVCATRDLQVSAGS